MYKILLILGCSTTLLSGCAFINQQSSQPIPQASVENTKSGEQIQDSAVAKNTPETIQLQNSTTTATSSNKSQTDATEPPTPIVCYGIDCFIQRLFKCDQGIYQRQINQDIVFNWNIVSGVSRRCEIDVTTVKHTNPTWIGKKMTCSYGENMRAWGAQYVEFCKGELADLMKARIKQAVISYPTEGCGGYGPQVDLGECAISSCNLEIELGHVHPYCALYLGSLGNPVVCNTTDPGDGILSRGCFTQAAQHGASRNQCDTIFDFKGRAYCYTALAKELRDGSLCAGSALTTYQKWDLADDYENWCKQVVSGESSFGIVSPVYTPIKKEHFDTLGDWKINGKAKIINSQLHLYAQGAGSRTVVSIDNFYPSASGMIVGRFKSITVNGNASNDDSFTFFYNGTPLYRSILVDLFAGSVDDSYPFFISSTGVKGSNFNFTLTATGDEEAEVIIDDLVISREFRP